MCQLQGQNDTNDVKKDLKREGGIVDVMEIDSQLPRSCTARGSSV